MHHLIIDRFGFWLEKFPFLDPILFVYGGSASEGGIYKINRINGHVTLEDES